MNKFNFPLLSIIGITLVAMHTPSCLSPKQESELGLPYYQEASFTPHWFSSSMEIPSNFHRVADFQLTNQEGKIIRRADLAGKVYVVDFFFTICPGICPKMTHNMALVQAAFADDESVKLLSHTVMPDYDQVEILAAYAQEKGVKANQWHLLTGSRETLYQLGRQTYFIEEDQGLDKTEADFLHTENFVLVDQQGYLRGIYNGLNRASVQQLIQDIKLLKQESAI